MPIYPRYHATDCAQDIDRSAHSLFPPVPQNERKMGSSAMDIYSLFLSSSPLSTQISRSHSSSLRMLDNRTQSLQPATGTSPPPHWARSPQYIPDQEPFSSPIHDSSLTPALEYDPRPRTRMVLIDDQSSSAPIAEFSESAAQSMTPICPHHQPKLRASASLFFPE